MSRNFYILALTLLLCVSKAQNKPFATQDSVYKIISVSKDPHVLFNSYYYLSLKYNLNTLDSAFSNAEKALTFAHKTQQDSCIFLALHQLSFICYFNGLNGKGFLFAREALQLAEKTKKPFMFSRAFNNLGLLYLSSKKYTDAVSCFTKSSFYNHALRDSSGLATSYNNMANAYLHANNFDSSVAFRKKALYIRKKHRQHSALADTYNDLGETYLKINRPDSAEHYFVMALLIKEQINDDEMLSIVHLNLGELYALKHNWYRAEQHYKSSLRFAEKINGLSYKVNAYEGLAKIYAKKNDVIAERNALKEILALSALLYDETNQKQVNSLHIAFETEKKALRLSALDLENKKQKQLYDARSFTKNIIIGFSVLLLFSVAVFWYILYKRYRLTVEQKKVIEQQEENTRQQKEEIQTKQRDILDSIQYARRIQNALLTPVSVIESFFPQCFVLFLPKDIVSGDFYWAKHFQNKVYLAVCDSTGHGVPGAMMSVLNASYLNDAITHQQLTDPGEIFEYVRNRLINSIGKEGQKDGFDGILLCYEKGINKLTYAAANNAPVLIDGNTITELHRDRMPVGIGEKEGVFTTCERIVYPGQQLYLYTDGFADQFGGEKNKKFMYRQLNKKLFDIRAHDMKNQGLALKTTFLNWKGSAEQIDDVCIIGIRF